MTGQPASPLRRRDIIVAVSCGLFVAGMVGAAYAAVPFYNWFCRATGFNGTTQVATAGPSGMLDRKVTGKVVVEPFGRIARTDRDALDADAQDVVRFLAGVADSPDAPTEHR